MYKRQLKKRVEKNTRRFTSFDDGTLAREFARHGFDVTGIEPQFLLPMVVHRMLGAPAWLRRLERGFAAIGLTRHLGSPAVLRADRRAETPP